MPSNYQYVTNVAYYLTQGEGGEAQKQKEEMRRK